MTSSTHRFKKPLRLGPGVEQRISASSHVRTAAAVFEEEIRNRHLAGSSSTSQTTVGALFRIEQMIDVLRKDAHLILNLLADTAIAVSRAADQTMARRSSRSKKSHRRPNLLSDD
jgi:hypothetical protein